MTVQGKRKKENNNTNKEAAEIKNLSLQKQNYFPSSVKGDTSVVINSPLLLLFTGEGDKY